MQQATLGGGCFWCLEAVFEQLKGVDKVVSGYAGGEDEAPTYQQVCTGTTGHAEVVQVTFDPAVITFRDLLEVFFSIHDPTTKDRQGNDVGTQYRSIVLAHDDEQERVARELIAELTDGKLYDAPIVTEVERLDAFHEAEDYHQGYYRANPNEGYCRVVISPKVAKFRKRWEARLRPST